MPIVPIHPKAETVHGAQGYPATAGDGWADGAPGGTATPAEGPYGRPVQPGPPRSRRRIKIWPWVVVLLVLALVVYPLALFFSVWTSLRRVDALSSTSSLP